MPWNTNHKHKIEEKSTKSSWSSSKVVSYGPADLWEFPTLIMTGNAPTTSEWSTLLLPTKLCLISEIWRYVSFIPRYCDPVQSATEYGVPSHGVVNPYECPAGYYCPSGTQHQHQYPCPPGTFSNETYLYEEPQCLPCTSGYYCDSNGRHQQGPFSVSCSE